MRKLLGSLFLCAVLCPIAYASPEQWVEVRGTHFTVLSDAGEKQARHIAAQLERMRWMFQVLFPNVNVDPVDPILVFALRNSKDFQTLEPAPYLGKGQLNLAGYFLRTPDRNYILLRLDAEQEHPFATVYHEYTHLQFSGDHEWMPLWLNEGLAEFIQNTDIHNKDVLLGQASADDILYLRQQSLIPLPMLFRVDASSPYYHQEQKGSIFYAESWALTHYLLVSDRQKGTNRLTGYMTRLSHHEDPVDAAQEEFGDLKQLQSSLETYIRASSYNYFVLNSAVAPIDEGSYSLTSVEPIQIDALRADVLASAQREQEARELIANVLQADPNNVQVRETLGTLELRHGNREEARKWFSEAVKLDSQSYLANYYFAQMSLFGPDIGPDNSVESSLRTAIKLNPKFAPAYSLLAMYLTRRKNFEEARRLSLQAIQLDPGSLGYRINAASELMAAEKYDDAANVLQSALKIARNPGEIATVQSVMGQLDQFRKVAQAERDIDVERTRADAQPGVQRIIVNNPPKHPSEATGPKHSVIGVIDAVTCSYPAVIEFQFQAAGKSLSLYNNNFSEIDLTALGFAPPDSMNPCRDFEGRKARIQYAESSDRSVDGKVLAVELRK